VDGQASLEEQPLAEIDRALVPRDAVARVGRPGRGPGAVRLDLARLVVCKRYGEGRSAEDEENEERALHSSRMVWATRSTASFERTSNPSPHFPAMWSISPSAL